MASGAGGLQGPWAAHQHLGSGWLSRVCPGPRAQVCPCGPFHWTGLPGRERGQSLLLLEEWS